MGFTKSTQAAAARAATIAPPDTGKLIALLDDGSAVVRRHAAQALASHPQAAPLLLVRVHTETDHSARGAMLNSLARIGGEDAVAGLARCLHSEEPALRNGAIEALKTLPEEVPGIIAPLLADADADVRIFAVNILESLRHPLVEDWLLDVVESDAHVNVCAAAVDLLCEIGTARAAPALQRLKARFSDEPYIHFAASFALKRLAGS
ncbi:HEAT repeat domain-containing protein [Pseudoduganella ginsengisoli]|nr:HEAT repeat domain-containing protein [Pseudoduganella ginsengisoli]